jgi:hypothetical protein
MVGMGSDNLTRYEVTDSTRYSKAWIWLLSLLIIGFATWRLYSSLAAFLIAVAGLILLMILRSKAKKSVGNYVELNDKVMIFGQGGENRCITFGEIKKVKTTRIGSLLGGPAYIIETSTGNQYRVQPDDYENGQQLREELTQRLEQLNYLPTKS